MTAQAVYNLALIYANIPSQDGTIDIDRTKDYRAKGLGWITDAQIEIARLQKINLVEYDVLNYTDELEIDDEYKTLMARIVAAELCLDDGDTTKYNFNQARVERMKLSVFTSEEQIEDVYNILQGL